MSFPETLELSLLRQRYLSRSAIRSTQLREFAQRHEVLVTPTAKRRVRSRYSLSREGAGGFPPPASVNSEKRRRRVPPQMRWRLAEIGGELSLPEDPEDRLQDYKTQRQGRRDFGPVTTTTPPKT